MKNKKTTYSKRFNNAQFDKTLESLLAPYYEDQKAWKKRMGLIKTTKKLSTNENCNVLCCPL